MKFKDAKILLSNIAKIPGLIVEDVSSVLICGATDAFHSSNHLKVVAERSVSTIPTFSKFTAVMKLLGGFAIHSCMASPVLSVRWL